MIQVRPFQALAAMAVFRQLDWSDHMEAELVRGVPALSLELFGDWYAVRGNCLINYVIETASGVPFALLALAHTGQAGVAQAALLARDHGRFRRPLAQLGAAIREQMPVWCQQHGVRRIEARAWTDHPTACKFLSQIGFRAECDMPGFGGAGTVTFRQFAWLAPTARPLAPMPSS